MLVSRPAPWPSGFVRVPDEPWTRAPVDAFALAYDGLGSHGWYANLDPTVATVAPWLDGGAIVVDYSGGTGLLGDRLLAARPNARGGVLNADASAKFLRLAAEKARAEPRLAVRLLPVEGGRVRPLDEVAPELAGRVDGVACANAVHLYPDVAEAARSWRALLRPGGRLHVQSGNLGPVDGDAWIIDATVAAIGAEARRLVAGEAGLARHRAALADPERMAAAEAVQRRYFPAARTVAETVDAIASAGFEVGPVSQREVTVDCGEWASFLSVYHEGVLPWVGRGSEPRDVEDRKRLIAEGLRSAVGGPRFRASWTYVDAVRAP